MEEHSGRRQVSPRMGSMLRGPPAEDPVLLGFRKEENIEWSWDAFQLCPERLRFCLHADELPWRNPPDARVMVPGPRGNQHNLPEIAGLQSILETFISEDGVRDCIPTIHF